jgi:hypothetical protein
MYTLKAAQPPLRHSALQYPTTHSANAALRAPVSAADCFVFVASQKRVLFEQALKEIQSCLGIVALKPVIKQVSVEGANLTKIGPSPTAAVTQLVSLREEEESDEPSLYRTFSQTVTTDQNESFGRVRAVTQEGQLRAQRALLQKEKEHRRRLYARASLTYLVQDVEVTFRQEMLELERAVWGRIRSLFYSAELSVEGEARRNRRDQLQKAGESSLLQAQQEFEVELSHRAAKEALDWEEEQYRYQRLCSSLLDSVYGDIKNPAESSLSLIFSSNV